MRERQTEGEREMRDQRGERARNKKTERKRMKARRERDRQVAMPMVSSRGIIEMSLRARARARQQDTTPASWGVSTSLEGGNMDETEPASDSQRGTCSSQASACEIDHAAAAACGVFCSLPLCVMSTAGAQRERERERG